MPAFVDCPTCRRRTEYSPANPWRPFCTERCKLIDLGVWADDGHVIPGEPLEPDPGTPPGSVAPRRVR